MDIRKIEKLTFEEVKLMAEEHLTIKDHDCFLINIGGYFGYSMLVYKNGRHIHYANDYELHHSSHRGDNKWMREWYISEANKKLFTDEELMNPINTYDEYNRKQHFLHNYWIMRYDYLSAFHIGKEDEERKKKRAKMPYYCSACFCYVSEENIAEQANKYMSFINAEFKKLKNNADTFREMISCELGNHEACITCDCTEALNALGLAWDNLTDIQKNIVKTELEANKRILI